MVWRNEYCVEEYLYHLNKYIILSNLTPFIIFVFYLRQNKLDAGFIDLLPEHYFSTFFGDDESEYNLRIDSRLIKKELPISVDSKSNIVSKHVNASAKTSSPKIEENNSALILSSDEEEEHKPEVKVEVNGN